MSTDINVVSGNGHASNKQSYDAIVSDSNIFWEKLGCLNSGKIYQLPIMGGTTLDLHRLFVEVTSRGGFDRVVKDRRWKELSCTFNFPTTITSASSLLKRYYRLFLLEMEHVYYVPRPVSSIQYSTDLATVSLSPDPEEDTDEPVQGVITGKIDNGYLVTVKIGSEEMKGVLFHTPETPSKSQETMETRSGTVSPLQAPDKKRPRLDVVDSQKPKCYKSGYNYFFAEQYARQESAIAKKIGYMWGNLSDSEKQAYQDKGLKDVENYRMKMLEYKASSDSGATSSAPANKNQ